MTTTTYRSFFCRDANDEVAPPPLSSIVSLTLCAFFTISYVGSLYLARAGRLAFNAPPIHVPNGAERVRVANEKWRNDPDVIRARLTAVSLSTVLSCLLVGLVVAAVDGCNNVGNSFYNALKLLGLALSRPSARDALPYLIVPVLYIGPLYVEALELRSPFRQKSTWTQILVDKFMSLQGIRNFVLGPVTEELVFRSCAISILILSGASTKRIVFASPLWFAIAHAHHAWELYNIYGQTKDAVKRAVLISLVQLTYTTLFGWLTAFLFVRTHSIYPPIVSHIFCNIMGLPAPKYASKRFPSHTSAIWIAHIVGIVGFVLVLGPWSR